jgi:hypothetical protein
MQDCWASDSWQSCGLLIVGLLVSGRGEREVLVGDPRILFAV